jgi:hypothetical protein
MDKLDLIQVLRNAIDLTKPEAEKVVPSLYFSPKEQKILF